MQFDSFMYRFSTYSFGNAATTEIEYAAKIEVHESILCSESSPESGSCILQDDKLLPCRLNSLSLILQFFQMTAS